MLNNSKKFLYIILFWLIVIFGYVGFKEYTLRVGYEVYLDIIPVDPSDIFRGDYIILNYKINRLNRDEIVISKNILNSEDIVNKDVYLNFKLTDQNTIEPFSLTDKLINSKDKSIRYIKGKVESFNNYNITVKYGIENYYIPRGQGFKFNQLSTDDLKVKVRIDRFGNALIEKILYKGQDLKLTEINSK